MYNMYIALMTDRDVCTYFMYQGCLINHCIFERNVADYIVSRVE